MSAYRETDESQDREGAAFVDLGQRRSRLRTRILATFLVAGALLGVPGYLLAREAQFALFDVSSPRIAATLGFFCPFAAAGAVGLTVARRVIRARTSRWLDELARHYKVKQERLAEVVEMIDAAEGG